MKTAQFKTGQTYTMRSPFDQDCTWTYRVARRTAKRIILHKVGSNADAITCGIKIHDDAEFCQPLGRYSMSPILRAN